MFDVVTTALEITGTAALILAAAAAAWLLAGPWAWPAALATGGVGCLTARAVLAAVDNAVTARRGMAPVRRRR